MKLSKTSTNYLKRFSLISILILSSLNCRADECDSAKVKANVIQGAEKVGLGALKAFEWFFVGLGNGEIYPIGMAPYDQNGDMIFELSDKVAKGITAAKNARIQAACIDNRGRIEANNSVANPATATQGNLFANPKAGLKRTSNDSVIVSTPALATK